MKNLIKPLILIMIFAISVLVLMTTNEFNRSFPIPRPLASALIALGIGFCLYYSLRFLLKILKLSHHKKQFTSHGFRMGVIYGLLCFALCFSIFILPKMPRGMMSIDGHVILSRVLFEVRPAVIEEITFRFGLAYFALHFYGIVGALIAGSFPFGILHLLNFIQGQSIDWQYIFGTGIAGLFLTSVFLRFNLAAAIATHFTWNVLATLASIAFAFQAQHLEAAHSTLAILLLLSYLILKSLKR